MEKDCSFKPNLLSLLRGDKSQDEMAKTFGVSQQGWCSWEKGRTVPSVKVLLEMERTFRIPMEVIFFRNFNYKTK